MKIQNPHPLTINRPPSPFHGEGKGNFLFSLLHRRWRRGQVEGQQMRCVLGLLCVLSFALPVSAQFLAWDPSRHTPNARVLGLGRAYVGLADDTAAIYMNPAGLGERKQWEFTTMSGKFANEFFYYSATGYMPLPLGVFGVGFAGSAVGGAPVTRIAEGSDPNDPIYEVDPTQQAVSNYNNVYLLSYGLKTADLMSRLKFNNQYLDKFNLGASIKLFSAGLSGDGITDGNASGTELDLGLQYQPPWPWLKLGMTVQNALPFSAGGKLRYANGHEETYPAVLETGLALKLLGQKGAFRTFPQELSFVYDIDYYPSLKLYPLVHHYGLEWKPVNMLAIRAGIDQDPQGDGAGGMTTVSNLTAGAGLYYGGFRFDYAYNEFKALPGVANSYFSLSYSPPEPMKAGIKDYFKISEPPDKLIIFAGEINLRGAIVDDQVKRIFINNSELRLDGGATFEAEITADLGKNKVVIEGFDERGKLRAPLDKKVFRILRLRAFSDVAPDYWDANQISLLAMLGIIGGYPDGSFRPEGNITRAEMCSLLMKTKEPKNERTEEPKNERTEELKFNDVPETHWAAAFIAQAAAAGIVKGYEDGSFKPGGNITRAEGIAMVARSAGISEETWEREFPDLSSLHWSAKIAAGAYRAGILEFLKGKRFEPGKELTRAETADMLYRTAFVQGLLGKDLLNWELY